MISISGISGLAQSAVVNYCLLKAELCVLAVTSLFGCTYYLSVEKQGNKQSKKSGKKPHTVSVYLGCAGSGQSEEGRDMRLHLQSDHVP